MVQAQVLVQFQAVSASVVEHHCHPASSMMTLAVSVPRIWIEEGRHTHLVIEAPIKITLLVIEDLLHLEVEVEDKDLLMAAIDTEIDTIIAAGTMIAIVEMEVEMETETTIITTITIEDHPPISFADTEDEGEDLLLRPAVPEKRPG
jgi:hypothetical protein